MNQFVQKVLLQFINNPTLQNQNIEFVPSSNKIQYFIEENGSSVLLKTYSQTL